MHLSVLVCLAALAVPQTAAAPQLSQQDRDRAVKYLQETRQKFLTSIDGLTPAQWTFKSAPDRWSIAEVSEHIAVSEGAILQLITEKVVTAPPAPAGTPLPTDEQVIAVVTDRSGRAQAPEMLRPANRWPTREALIAAFETGRQKTTEFVKTTPENLRGHAAPHPALKMIDAYQWVLLQGAHSARHTAQIEEVKASAGYPR